MRDNTRSETVKAIRTLHYRPFSLRLALTLALALSVAPSVRANVFASNIKINGGITNITLAPGTNVAISYILNEPASAGVAIKVFAGASTIRTIIITNGPGTARGTNTFVWDGKTDGGGDPPGGTYSVSITAASQGYPVWTKTTDDNNPGNYSYEPMGIAVDRNTSSPYYGRVFVANAWDNSGDPTTPLNGNLPGIQLLNADGSYADGGGFSTGGVGWSGGNASPWKIRVSEDDFVYVADVSAWGDIYRFDGALSSNSMLHVFSETNAAEYWTGLDVVGRGTNTVLWAADNVGALGISMFGVQPDGTFDASAPAQVVDMSTNAPPYAVGVDRTGAIYTLSYILDTGVDRMRVFRFPPYNSIINSNMPETNADWEVPPSADNGGGHGIAIDPTGTYVAAAFRGYQPAFSFVDGNLQIYSAADGSPVTNLDLGIGYTNRWTSDPFQHQDLAVDWDAVGNVYYTDEVPGCWRAFSPPGTNQATTVALAKLQVGGAVVAPYIVSISVSGGMVVIHFTAGSSDTASMFTLLSSSVAQTGYSPESSAVITGSGGSFQATVPVNGPVRFYRIMRGSTVLPHITGLSVSSGIALISFTGSASDPASAFTLLSSGSVAAKPSPAAGALITQVSPGSFQASVAAAAQSQFYRIQR